ncbi:DmpA family aminopeptidase [Neobacillus vireti]|uniref:Peptidase S58 DmpA n=1 Tax=Neobacillus vireti LMG 21834 TaxID=1131730 RepID=A0AB94IPD3_9BACI|nr:P1 family peptidase [Neobacillus vireti]ETI68971.1 peptidase S58 DmpA [Neobacillus vireti LMG 21834]KLT15731.1 aminopeptidase [Neobacillus vireti]
MSKKRARDLGLPFPGIPGEFNALTDVPGVEIGFTTIIEGEGQVQIGKGPIRTGVTAILPRGKKEKMKPIWAGFYSLNGNGEMTGVHWVNDGGYFLSPICITNTHSVGIAHHATTKWMVNNYEKQFSTEHLWAMPVIAETYDGVLNDINGQHITEEHVLSAIDGAHPGPVSEGNVGGGTGMICYEFKGGTGTSSRVVTINGQQHHIGVLVQANFGLREWLTIIGVPVGKHMSNGKLLENEQGSIIVIIGTDIPMLPHQLKRVAKRAAIGIGRSGSPGGNSSGDIFLAFSTANEMDILQLSQEKLTMEFVNDEGFDPIYEAVCQAVDESVVNALIAAESMTTVKPYGKIVHAINHEELLRVMREYNRV